jgi:hypothetical protein
VEHEVVLKRDRAASAADQRQRPEQEEKRSQHEPSCLGLEPRSTGLVGDPVLANHRWQNGAYWLSQATIVTSPSDGTQTLRIQVREDGVQFDQIVLSPSQYRNAAPGPVSNDAAIVPK